MQEADKWGLEVNCGLTYTLLKVRKTEIIFNVVALIPLCAILKDKCMENKPHVAYPATL
jgi:hypothetical protein